MHFTNMRLLTVLLSYLLTRVNTYPMQGWPMWGQVPREYPDDEYYYAPKIQYYYDAPAVNVPEMHGQVQYPYYYDPNAHYLDNDAPQRHEERLAALPIGQETWFESETTPRWQSNEVDDVSAAFLDNLILTQMAQDAQRRRENARAAFLPVDYEDKDLEDEDERELKALAGKPLYHVPKTGARYDEEDYPGDDSFINWNGNKRSPTTVAPIPSTVTPKAGDKEVMVPRPPQNHQTKQNKRSNFYNTLAELWANKSSNSKAKESLKERRIEKRFVADNSDPVLQLRGLKRRIAT